MGMSSPSSFNQIIEYFETLVGKIVKLTLNTDKSTEGKIKEIKGPMICLEVKGGTISIPYWAITELIEKEEKE